MMTLQPNPFLKHLNSDALKSNHDEMPQQEESLYMEISISISFITAIAKGFIDSGFVPALLIDILLRYFFASPSAICDLQEFPVHKNKIFLFRISNPFKWIYNT